MGEEGCVDSLPTGRARGTIPAQQILSFKRGPTFSQVAMSGSGATSGSTVISGKGRPPGQTTGCNRPSSLGQDGSCRYGPPCAETSQKQSKGDGSDSIIYPGAIPAKGGLLFGSNASQASAVAQETGAQAGLVGSAPHAIRPLGKMTAQGSTRRSPATSRQARSSKDGEGSRPGGEAQSCARRKCISRTQRVWISEESENSSPSLNPPETPGMRYVSPNLASLLQSFPSLESRRRRSRVNSSRISSERHGAAIASSIASSSSDSSAVSSMERREGGGPRAGFPADPPRTREQSVESKARPRSTPEQIPRYSIRMTRNPNTAVGSSGASFEPTSRKINVGIEAEIYLGSLQEPSKPSKIAKTKPTNSNRSIIKEPLDVFVETVAATYNEQVSAQHPRMRENRRPYEWKGAYRDWSLVEDHTIRRPWPPWGLELVSPIFSAHIGSSWRRDVDVTWQHLQRNHQITSGEKCATHVHISFQRRMAFTADEIRRIARCVIHFEPALEAVVPPSRRGNPYAKSNWLEGQHLGQQGKSRSESLDAIDAVPVKNEQDDMTAVIGLIQDLNDRDFAWNFTNLLWAGKKTIEFRKPPGSTNADEALSWAEFAISFLQASVKDGVRDRLRRVPSTVGGLKWFLKQAYETGVNQPGRLERIWRGIPDHAAAAPKPVKMDYWGPDLRALEKKLHKLAMDDIGQVLEFAERTREPYW